MLEGMDTPFVQIDGDIFDRNIRAMGEDMSRRRIALWPHVKTHKIPQIADLQRAW